MRVGTEDTTPGVERRKELSLSVKEWSSPESRKGGLTQTARSLLHIEHSTVLDMKLFKRVILI